MSENSKNTLKQLGIASGIATVLIIVVVMFISSQAPDSQNNIGSGEPPIMLPLVSIGLEDLEKEKDKAKDETPKKSEKVKKSDDSKKEQEKTKLAKVKKPLKKNSQHKKTKAKAATKSKQQEQVATHGEGLKIKFKNLASLERLIADDHVQIVLEYGDGTRFMLPEELQDEKIVLNVPLEAFAEWLSEGRVSELEATEDLMSRIKVHRTNVRYLAVLSADLRDSIAIEAKRAGANLKRSIMVIDEAKGRSVVSVLLPRR